MLSIPKRFDDILKKNYSLYGVVMKTCADYSEIIKNSEFEFFPEYTDHRIDHLNHVLKTCDFIITDESFEFMTAEDITVLVLAVLLHDIGMHITHEGILSLTKGELKHRKVPNMDKVEWDELWNTYLNEIKKFSDKDIKNVFGSIVNIKEPSENKDLLTRHDRKLYGEFIRRYHPRMAHEIALYGFPSKDSKTIPFAEGLDEDFKAIIGIVARSHGMDLRDTYSYLQNNFGRLWKTPRSVKAIFLMVILRIADYLHITSERAPIISLNTKNITSTISKKEWDLHRSVKEISNDLPDSESLYIVSEPENSEIYLKMKRLIKDIQKELDTSWGVLGEVYSSLGEYNRLKLKLRRIQSNLEDDDYLKKLNYIPKEVFCSSDTDLLKLLIAPLYGDNISFGVRELLQNAVDACKEREILNKKEGQLNQYTPEICIKIIQEDENNYFVIKDNGIGMNEDIIVNYFLKAGASFRNSEIWKKDYEDESHNSMVQRTGKFGVGVFAGYILGEQMEVKTRHLKSNQILRFLVGIDQEQIEVCRLGATSFEEVGTEIKIKISNKVLEEFKAQLIKGPRYGEAAWFDWYKLEEPEILIEVPDEWPKYKIENYKKNKKRKVVLHTIKVKDYKEVKWTYDLNYEGSNNLISNGIIIPKGYNIKGSNFPRFENGGPTIVMLDYDGKLPLSLNRNEVYGDLPFQEELIRDVVKDINNELLSMSVLNIDSSGRITVINNQINHKSLNDRYYSYYKNPIEEKDIILFETGYCLFLSYNVEIMKINKITKIWSDSLDDMFINQRSLLKGIIFSDKKIKAIDDYKRVMDIEQVGTDRNFKVTSKRIILNKTKFDYLMEGDRMRVGFKNNIHVERRGDNIVSVIQGNPGESLYDFDFLDKNYKDFTIIVEYGIGELVSTNEESPNISYEIAKELFGGKVIIPYFERDGLCIESHSPNDINTSKEVEINSF
ncbi:hypothetical protein CN315_07945 [Bacillus cereus]|nr:hypothetical protein CN315_07945 [Bacillus cereus]